MNEKKPFLSRFKTPLQAQDPIVQEDLYSDVLQANILNGEWVWKGQQHYTSIHTAPKYVKGHYTPTNKWISGRTRPGKLDRRVGK